MTEGLGLGWSAEQNRSARVLYQRVLGFNMFLHIFVGVSCIFLPGWVSDTVGLPDPFPTGWTRGWGATLMLVTALYVPGLLDPERNRAPNLIGILGRVWMGSIWVACGLIGERGFFAFAVFDYVWALIIGLLYLRLVKSTIMNRP